MPCHIVQKSVSRNFKKAAVCAGADECAEIGLSILKKGGTAVDSAIATMICNGLVHMHIAGYGGGFFMTIYQSDTKKVSFLNAKEESPKETTEYSYKQLPLDAKSGLRIAVPGEIAGYAEAHKKFGSGKISWSELFQPTIDLCKNGFKITKTLHDALEKSQSDIENDETLRELFMDNKTNSQSLKREGQLVNQTTLCKTLATIALNGSSEFYNGTLTKTIVDDLQKQDLPSIITEDDFSNYKAEWLEPLSIKLSNDLTLHTSNVPSSGGLLTLIMNILDEFNFTPNSLNDYAKSIKKKINETKTSNTESDYGGKESVNDQGTAQVSVIDSKGNAVSATSSINAPFGSGIVSKSTGLIFNNAMDAFWTPTVTGPTGGEESQDGNRIDAQKKPLSSMLPTIITDSKGDVKVVIGGTGGTKIITSVLARYLWMGENMKTAIDANRIHYQDIVMKVGTEKMDNVAQKLKKNYGHRVVLLKEPHSAICSLSKENGIINGVADGRRGGNVTGE
ncbi:glutathione hydrolase 1 proenzyme-like [Aphidius gifuensis]|uniref:glutathione hydrolase 1 proenzyme-like n=1 Tax=Aphidius gifuensis TaxID=684658 RepID=UPI001CDD7E57|nr:glutathione hydrolase 1 proenzyme-like [Aphidius gifuensis]